MGREMLEIFKFSEYRLIIKYYIEKFKSARGYRAKLARAASCHPSFLSQVLQSHVHITPDQAANMCSFWAFDEKASEYFITLVLMERSSSQAFRSMLQRRANAVKRSYDNISERVSLETLEADRKLSYYSSWLMQAVHILLSLKEFQNPERLATKLNLSVNRITQIIDELKRLELIEKDPKGYTLLNRALHLEKSSPLFATYHSQWRQYAIMKIHENSSEAINYTATLTISKADYLLVKSEIYKLIENVTKLASTSKEEEACCLNIDFLAL